MRRPSIPQYAIRRLLRIVPAYWVALTVLGALFPIGVGSHALVYYGFAQIYSDSTLYGALSPAWTLCVDAAFYAVLPLYVLATKSTSLRNEYRLLGAIAIASLVARAAATAMDASPWIFASPPMYFDWFAIGMLLAVWNVQRQLTQPSGGFAPKPGLCWGGVLVGLIALIVLLPRTSLLAWYFQHLIYGPLALLALIPATDPDGRRLAVRIFGSAWLVWLGVVSYGMYLWHRPLANWMADHVGRQPVVTAAGTLAVSLALGTASWFLIEKPLMRWSSNRLRGRRRTIKAAALGARPPA